LPFVEAVDRKVLGERDGWVCGILGGAIDRTLEWPNLQSASHDHIVPVARGGEESYANAQIAHLVCNIRKGAITPT
jgi:5-methylcytosine-specific restriction endonuclease McrA